MDVGRLADGVAAFFLRHEFICARTEPCAGWRRFRYATGQDGRHGDFLAGEKSEPARFPNCPGESWRSCWLPPQPDLGGSDLSRIVIASRNSTQLQLLLKSASVLPKTKAVAGFYLAIARAKLRSA
jgi:hypothetical protein